MTSPAAAGRGVMVLAALLLGTEPVTGQEIRVTGLTSVRYVEVRALVDDSLPVEATRGDGLLRRADDGQLVRCVDGEAFCTFFRPGGTKRAMPTIQDITVAGWGFATGVRVHARLRLRSDLGVGDELWPRSGDTFDALAAYAELDRGRLRVRAGRDWKSSGLGSYNYDGAAVLVRPRRDLETEVFGGWSLARGVNEAVSGGALAAIEPFAPDERALLLGAQLRYRPSARLGLAALYQREIRSDRAGLYSERLALDASLRRSRASVRATLELDLVAREANDARVDLTFLARPDLSLGGFVRHYRPFFELWTIWGAFDPVGFDEAGLSGAWTRGMGSLRVEVRGAWRRYPETSSDVGFLPVRSEGWRVGARVSGRLSPSWTAQGGYQADAGFGAGLEELMAGVRRDAGRAWLGATATAFRRIDGLRVDEGTVLGLSVDGGLDLGDRWRASGSLAYYRHRPGSQTPSPDWNQVRGALRLEWTLGPEPGLDPEAEP